LHLEYHQTRFDQTRRTLFTCQEPIALARAIIPPCRGVFRVRVEYRETITRIDYRAYEPTPIRTIALVESPLAYDYKYCDREALNLLKRDDADEVLIVCHGELKDTTIANIALWIDGEWKTPLRPLLEGTTRARLLAQGKIKAESLSVGDIQKARKFAIMNALRGFEILENVCVKD